MAKQERIEDAVDALLAAPAGHRVTGGQAAVELVLTEGYARALELEAERLRAPGPGAVASLTERLLSLRHRLDAVRRRYGVPRSARDHDLDRGPGPGGRMNDELTA